MGLFIYSAIAIGLGCWPKFRADTSFSTIGLRLTLGYATAILIGYLLLISGLSISMILPILGILAAGGIIFNFVTTKFRYSWSNLIFHPGSVLLLLGLVLVLIKSDLNYLPIGNDEFSNWLANPIRLHVNETWFDARQVFHHVGYTPGWPIILALPWQVSGTVEFGASTAAPFVFCVAVTALVYDIAVWLLRHRGELPSTTAGLLGWGFILLFAGVQAMGPLWSQTLLIEAPQIYGYVAFLLLVYASEIINEHRRLMEGAAGIVLASCYLIKSAALLFAPAVLLLCLFDFVGREGGLKKRFWHAGTTGGLLLTPLIVVAASWSLDMTASNCYFRPLETLTPEAFAHAANYDWVDLGRRFFGTAGGYILHYKLALTIGAGAGLIGTVFCGRERGTLLLVAMAILYFVALYWFHLTCFGDYYFKVLNSVPRFTRVIVWTMHGIGLVMLLDVALTLIRQRFGIDALAKLVAWRTCLVGILLSVVGLGIWQTNQVFESLIEVTTRRNTFLDPRIAETRQAAKTIEQLAGQSLPKRPVLLLLLQGGDMGVLSYARFYSMGKRRGDVEPRYKIIPRFSWAPIPVNTWQSEADPSQVRKRFAEADIVWPIVVNPWLVDIVSRMVKNPTCLKDLSGHYLVRLPQTDGTPRFQCFDKKPAGK